MRLYFWILLGMWALPLLAQPPAKTRRDYQAEGTQHLLKQQFAQAKEAFAQARTVLAPQKDKLPLEYAAATGMLAKCFHELGDYPQARTLMEESVECRRKLLPRESTAYATALHSLAAFYVYQSNYVRAKQLLDEALPILRADRFFPTKLSYALALTTLAMLHTDQNDLLAAELSLEEALEVYAKYPGIGLRHPLYANSLREMGNVLSLLGKMGRAEALWREALEIFQRHPNLHFQHAQVLGGLASASYWKNEMDSAVYLYQQALQALREGNLTDHPLEAGIQTGLADCYRFQGLLPDAIGEMERAMGQLAKGYGTTSYNYLLPECKLALLYIDASRFAQADSVLATLSPKVANIFGTENVFYAKVLGLRAASYFWQAQPGPALASARQSLGILKRDFARLAPSLGERQERELLAYLDEHFNFYYYLALQLAPGQPDLTAEIFSQRLTNRALSLRNAAQVGRAVAASGDTSLVAQYRHWRATCSASSSRAASDTLVPGWRDVQRRLRRGEALVEIFHCQLPVQDKSSDQGSRIYAALIVTPDTKKQPSLVLLPSGSLLEGSALADYRRDRGQGGDAHATYWGPLAAHLAGAKTVYLCPDGVYHEIGLAGLHNPEAGRFVGDEVDIRLLNSPRDLLDKQASRPPRDRGIALFGHPDYGATQAELTQTRKLGAGLRGGRGGPSTAPLPYTRTEVLLIDSLARAGGWATSLDTGKLASEDAVKATSRPSVLHLATHGYFTPAEGPGAKDPMLRAGLVMAGAAPFVHRRDSLPEGGEDGLLTAYEVAGLDLQGTDLAALSACETGLGDVQPGEGVYGLRRAFAIAGARSVLMSLWQVDDRATQLLMAAFYRRYLAGTDKHLALQLAQKELRQNPSFAHPKYWAGFVLVGR
jgi:tetratricopeptide (TPR) repeat protein